MFRHQVSLTKDYFALSIYPFRKNKTGEKKCSLQFNKYFYYRNGKRNFFQVENIPNYEELPQVTLLMPFPDKFSYQGM
jgi:hypothetical protein